MVAPDDPERGRAYQLHADLCKVLTEPKRLVILEALRRGESSVGELAAALGCSLPNVSQHLGVLRHAGLVSAHRVGTTVNYRLSEPRIALACDIVHAIVRDRLGSPLPPGERRRPPGRWAGSSPRP